MNKKDSKALSGICDYCKGIGACPTCWGRAAIDELKEQKTELLEACKVALKMIDLSIDGADNLVSKQLNEAINRAEGR